MVRADAVEYPAEPRAAAAPCTDQLSRKERRAVENAACIGGMRSPWKSVRRLPRVAAAAARVRRVIDEAFVLKPKLLSIVDLLGTDVPEDSDRFRWMRAQADIIAEKCLEELGGAGAVEEPVVHMTWHADLVEAFVREADDPEKDLVRWLRVGCPAGIAGPSRARASFPGARNSRGQEASWSRGCLRTSR